MIGCRQLAKIAKLHALTLSLFEREATNGNPMKDFRDKAKFFFLKTNYACNIFAQKYVF